MVHDATERERFDAWQVIGGDGDVTLAPRDGVVQQNGGSQVGFGVLIGTFASVVTLTSVMWFIQTGRLAFP